MTNLAHLTQSILNKALEHTTVTDLAKEMNISRSQLHRIISGASQPSASQLEQILNLSNLKVAVLTTDEYNNLKENAHVMNTFAKLVKTLKAAE